MLVILTLLPGKIWMLIDNAMKQHIDVLTLDINKSNPNLLLMHC